MQGKHGLSQEVWKIIYFVGSGCTICFAITWMCLRWFSTSTRLYKSSLNHYLGNIFLFFPTIFAANLGIGQNFKSNKPYKYCGCGNDTNFASIYTTSSLVNLQHLQANPSDLVDLFLAKRGGEKTTWPNLLALELVNWGSISCLCLNIFAHVTSRDQLWQHSFKVEKNLEHHVHLEICCL